ncbi:MAG TPA: hypothetical protein DDZ51_07530 [Planctomycetaceae bacterium]|nr:hypothetical protein [Planctomycetaceae bacterium]
MTAYEMQQRFRQMRTRQQEAEANWHRTKQQSSTIFECDQTWHLLLCWMCEKNEKPIKTDPSCLLGIKLQKKAREADGKDARSR